jgi:hypothetical protein
MWTARWGHAFAVVNQTSTYRNDMTVEENSMRASQLSPRLYLLGGDDYQGDNEISIIHG